MSAAAEVLTARLATERLEILGGFHPDPGEAGLPAGTQTLLLVGPSEPGFWAHVQAQADWSDRNPIDAWSARILGKIADEFGAAPLFPFGGPPYHPFHSWARRTGRIWESPVKLLVHSGQGLWVSFRGALALRYRLALPPPALRPCDTCTEPCLSACPAGALGAEGYDVPACHRFLDTAAGQECLGGGCYVRRACPVSQAHARIEEQSAYHMRRFHAAAKTAGSEGRE